MSTKSSAKSKITKKSTKAKSSVSSKKPEENPPVIAESTIVIPDSATTVEDLTKSKETQSEGSIEQSSSGMTVTPIKKTEETQTPPDETTYAKEKTTNLASSTIKSVEPTLEDKTVQEPTETPATDTDNVLPTMPDVEGDQEFVAEEKGSGKKLIIVFITALLIGGLTVAAFFYFANPYKKSENEKPAEETVKTIEEEPTPVLDEKEATNSADIENVDLSAYSVQILNGSGVAGEAGVVQELLADIGFEDFEIGNADSYDYTVTEVQIKEGTSASVYEAIDDVLSKDGYTVTEKDVLSEDNQYDIVIVIGTK